MNRATLQLDVVDFVDGASAPDYRLLKPSVIPQWLATAGIAAALVAAVYCGWVNRSLPDFAAWSATLWLLLALLSSVLISPRVYTPGFLISLLAYLIAWRVSAMNDAHVLMWTATIGFIPMVLQFIDCVVGDWRRNRTRSGAWLGTLLWQSTIVRMVFGLNELGHATEKLFAGQDSFHHLVKGFQGFGLTQSAALFVVMAGLTELASAISVGLGFLTRGGALLSIGYFLVATVGFGGEWGRGYAWATAGGGGWEYVMLLLAVFGSLLLTGAGKFSIDGWLLQRGLLPKWLVPLATNAQGAR